MSCLAKKTGRSITILYCTKVACLNQGIIWVLVNTDMVSICTYSGMYIPTLRIGYYLYVHTVGCIYQ